MTRTDGSEGGEDFSRIHELHRRIQATSPDPRAAAADRHRRELREFSAAWKARDRRIDAACMVVACVAVVAALSVIVMAIMAAILRG